MQRRLPLLAGVLACILSGTLSAQGRRPRLGDEVRVTAPSVGIQARRGILVARDSRRLRVDSLYVPLSSIARMEVHRGRKRWWLEGLGLGMTAGITVGVAFGPDCDSATGSGTVSCGFGEAVIGVLGGLAGAFTGFFFGSAIVTDRWEDVPLDSAAINGASRYVIALGVAR